VPARLISTTPSIESNSAPSVQTSCASTGTHPSASRLARYAGIRDVLRYRCVLWGCAGTRSRENPGWLLMIVSANDPRTCRILSSAGRSASAEYSR
jgi:hypothetical protein